MKRRIFREGLLVKKLKKYCRVQKSILSQEKDSRHSKTIDNWYDFFHVRSEKYEVRSEKVLFVESTRGFVYLESH